MNKALLAISQLHKHYHQGNEAIRVLDGLELSINAGESVAITGASGSGKSTLLHLIAGLDRADSGQIEFAGDALHSAGEAELDQFRRQHLGLVYQKFNLVDCLTVQENIELPVHLKKLPLEQAKIAPIIEALGLENMTTRYPWQLSGGQQQRVAIARALAHQPELILADEPTGNLDDEHSEQVADLLYRLCRERNSALVIVTHSQSVARRADRQLHLHNGLLGA